MTAQASDGAYGWRNTLAPTLALFTSFGTLICCALPALFVALGLGAAVAGLVSAVPQVVWLSEHKAGVFAGSALMIAAAAALHRASRNAPCPSDPIKAKACARLRTFSAAVLWIATIAWAAGAFMAFLAAPIFFGAA
jgi:hypothetical protein